VIVEDDEAALERALTGEGALSVILSGPGGSSGDIVRRVLARVAGVRLVLSERMRAALEEWAQRQDRPLPRRADRLALLPQGAIVWSQPGLEPAWAFESSGAAFVAIPRSAAPEAILDAHLVPFVRARLGTRGGVALRTLKTAGVGLAEIEERLADWLGPVIAGGGEVEVSTVPADAEVWVRLRARGATASAAAEALAVAEDKIGALLGPDCYGRDEDGLERVVGRLLLAQGLTVSVAESCTGGLLGHRLTNVPGSSAYFERGVLVYSNLAKQELLGVPEAVLRAHGAVSAPCAEAMAAGICRLSGSACGVAITGIAGPDGGTPTKPVGTVFIGLALSGRIAAHRFRFPGDRAAVKWHSAQMALDLLRRGLAPGAA
jgi:nicotinamide-nucleotide amidase